MKKPETSLLVAASDHDANMLYAVGMFVPDPFIYFNDGSSIDTANNVLTMANGTQIDTTTGLQIIDQSSIISMANGAYLDTKNNILHMSDGTKVDTVTGLKITA